MANGSDVVKCRAVPLRNPRIWRDVRQPIEDQVRPVWIRQIPMYFIDSCAALRAQSPRHICTLLRATALLLTSFFAVKPAEFSVILLQRQVEKVIEDRLNRILSIAIERNALNAEICISCISYYKCHEHLSRTRPSGIYAVNLPLSSTLIRKKKL